MFTTSLTTVGCGASPTAPGAPAGLDAGSTSSSRPVRCAPDPAMGNAVRIGTHALKAGSRGTLWGRLSQHRGAREGGGNHRGSIFRLLVGVALARRQGTAPPRSWGIGSDRGSASRRLELGRESIKCSELALEVRVSDYIGAMPFLWLDIDDEPGPTSDRGLVERNAIGLLSASTSPAPDTASAGWLGQFSDRARVRGSGLWNSNHVDESYVPSFLDTLDEYVRMHQMR